MYSTLHFQLNSALTSYKLSYDLSYYSILEKSYLHKLVFSLINTQAIPTSKICLDNSIAHDFFVMQIKNTTSILRAKCSYLFQWRLMSTLSSERKMSSQTPTCAHVTNNWNLLCNRLSTCVRTCIEWEKLSCIA